MKWIFYHRQSTHNGVCKAYEGMISTKPLGTFDQPSLKEILFGHTSPEYRINREMYTMYEGEAGISLHRNGKFIKGAQFLPIRMLIVC